MTDLATIVEQQLDAILDEAEPAWLDREPEVREEVSFIGFDDDTYAHQRYAFYSAICQEGYEAQRKLLFGSPDEQPEDYPLLRSLQQMASQQEDSDGPTP